MATAFGIGLRALLSSKSPSPGLQSLAWRLTLGPRQIALLLPLAGSLTCIGRNDGRVLSLHFLSRFHLKIPLYPLSPSYAIGSSCGHSPFLQIHQFQLFQYFTSAFPCLSQLLLFLEQHTHASLCTIVEATDIQYIAFSTTTQYLDSDPNRVCKKALAVYPDHVRLGRR